MNSGIFKTGADYNQWPFLEIPARRLGRRHLLMRGLASIELADQNQSRAVLSK
jgi:hypothetical protein